MRCDPLSCAQATRLSPSTQQQSRDTCPYNFPSQTQTIVKEPLALILIDGHRKRLPQAAFYSHNKPILELDCLADTLFMGPYARKFLADDWPLERLLGQSLTLSIASSLAVVVTATAFAVHGITLSLLLWICAAITVGSTRAILLSSMPRETQNKPRYQR